MTAPTASPTLLRIAVIWTALVTLIPAVFGVVMLVNPALVATPGTQTADVFRAMAFRNFAFSAVLGAALATQPKRVVAFLLAARGLTEWADGLSGIFAASPGAAAGPFIGGLGDVLFALYFFRTAAPGAAGPDRERENP